MNQGLKNESDKTGRMKPFMPDMPMYNPYMFPVFPDFRYGMNNFGLYTQMPHGFRPQRQGNPFNVLGETEPSNTSLNTITTQSMKNNDK